MNEVVKAAAVRHIDTEKYRQSVNKLRQLIDAHKQLDRQCDRTNNNNNSYSYNKSNGSASYRRRQASGRGSGVDSVADSVESVTDDEPVREGSNDGNSKCRVLRNKQQQQQQGDNIKSDKDRQECSERMRNFVVKQEQLLQQLREENQQLRTCYQQLSRHVYRLLDENSTLGKQMSDQIMSTSLSDIEHLARGLCAQSNNNNSDGHQKPETAPSKSAAAAAATVNSTSSEKIQSQDNGQVTTEAAEELRKTAQRYKELAEAADHREQAALKQLKHCVTIGEQSQQETASLQTECQQLKRMLHELQQRMDNAVMERDAQLTQQRIAAEYTLCRETQQQQLQLQQQRLQLQQLEAERDILAEKTKRDEEEKREERETMKQLEQQYRQQQLQHQQQLDTLNKQCSKLGDEREQLADRLERQQREQSNERALSDQQLRQLQSQLTAAEQQLVSCHRRQAQLEQQVSSLAGQVEAADQSQQRAQRERAEDVQTLFALAKRREHELLTMLETVQAASNSSRQRLQQILLEQSDLLRRAHTENATLCEQLEKMHWQQQRQTATNT